MYKHKPLKIKNYDIPCLSLSHKNTTLKKANFSSDEQQFLKRVRHVVSENIKNKKFSVTEFAKHMYMGRGNLYRLIKSLTGLSPNAIIAKARLSAGKFLLENSDLRVNEIAEEVGYTDNAYFSRAFRKHYGYPPSKVRI